LGTRKRIKLYDGYRGKAIWKHPKNNSVYYNYEIDKQCRIPIGSREGVIDELGDKQGK